jgi:iron(II)-dependent oxidoreductase
MNLARVFAFTAVLSALSVGAFAQDTNFEPDGQQIPAPNCSRPNDVWDASSQPCTREDHEAWLADVRHWRSERLIRIGYDGSRYDLPALRWTQSSFFQPQMMVHERYF